MRDFNTQLDTFNEWLLEVDQDQNLGEGDIQRLRNLHTRLGVMLQDLEMKELCYG